MPLFLFSPQVGDMDKKRLMQCDKVASAPDATSRAHSPTDSIQAIKTLQNSRRIEGLYNINAALSVRLKKNGKIKWAH